MHGAEAAGESDVVQTLLATLDRPSARAVALAVKAAAAAGSWDAVGAAFARCDPRDATPVARATALSALKLSLIHL